MLLSANERGVLRTFQQFLVAPGQMLCFHGPSLEKYKSALQQLTEKQLLRKDHINGAYTLTREGFDAMKLCR